MYQNTIEHMGNSWYDLNTGLMSLPPPAATNQGQTSSETFLPHPSRKTMCTVFSVHSPLCNSSEPEWCLKERCTVSGHHWPLATCHAIIFRKENIKYNRRRVLQEQPVAHVSNDHDLTQAGRRWNWKPWIWTQPARERASKVGSIKLTLRLLTPRTSPALFEVTDAWGVHCSGYYMQLSTDPAAYVTRK